MNKRIISKIIVFVVIFVAVFGFASIKDVEACDYCDYGYSNYYNNDYCYYYECVNTYSYQYQANPYRYQQYPEISYIPKQNNSGSYYSYQFQRYPDIVYVPHNQSNSFNPYNTTTTNNSMYYQGSQIQSMGYYGSNYGYDPSYQNYNNGYYNNNNWGYQGIYQDLYQSGGQFIRTN